MNSNLTPFLLIAVSVGLFYTYINPQYVKIEELRAQETRYAEAMQQVREIETIKQELLTKYNSFTPDEIGRLEKLLPDQVDDVRLVLDLDGMASRHNILIKGVKVVRPAEVQAFDVNAQPKMYDALKVTFSFEADFENFLAFTKELEGSLQIVDPTLVSIRAANGGRFEYTMTVNAYWLK